MNELGAELSDRYWSRSKFQQTDTAYMYTMLAMNESRQLNYIRGMGKSLLNLSIIEEEHGNFKAAEEYIRNALPILKQENMQADYHRSSVFLGFILQNRGLLDQSIQIYKHELPYYEAIKDSEHIAAICRITARAYDLQGNSENAFNYIQKDFAIQKTSQDAWGKRSTATLKAAVYLAAGDTGNAVYYYKQAAFASLNQHVILGGYHSNLAVAYSLQNKYDSALREIRENIIEIQSSKKDSLYRKVAFMGNYNQLIGLFFSLKQFDSVLVYYSEPLRFFKNGDAVGSLMGLLKTVAATYHAKGQNLIALYYTNELLSYAQKAGARLFKRDGYKLLWQIYEDQHKPNLAADFHLKYLLLNDSLEKNKYISQAAAWKAINDITINEANYKNQLQLTEERNAARITLIKDEKKSQLYAFITSIVLLSLFTLLIIRNNRLKRNKERLQSMIAEANILLEKQKREQEVTHLQQQKTALELQALRAQMNPHFIFNCLNSINRFIIKNDPEKLLTILTKFAKLIRMVLEQSGKSFVPLEDELYCLQLYMDLEALRFEKPFNYEINCDGY